ncbi:MAG: hypothetical protein LBB65_01920 [Burkholderiales bacterium]|nr:hypothetical protein [Burkholderiales bacterium]
MSEPAEAVRFFYVGGDPMAYAAIKVFSPADDKVAYQEGFADGNGRFAFVPNATGDWRVAASDGMGHRAEAVVAHVAATGGEGANARSEKNTSAENTNAENANANNHAASVRYEGPTVWKALLGLSVILNLALLAQWAVQRSRRNSEGAAHAHQ